MSGVPLPGTADIAEIELFLLKRMKQFEPGSHSSIFKGAGFDFAGLRDWESGDLASTIDWAQSSLNGFSPLLTREFEQDSAGVVLVAADVSRSTLCGVGHTTTAAVIARAAAVCGLAALFAQDQFGVVTFVHRSRQRGAARPRIGRAHVLHCLDLIQQRRRTPIAAGRDEGIGPMIAEQLRSAALVPVISDFLFPEAPRVIGELERLNAVHDVCLIVADARFAYELPALSAGWIWLRDVETGADRIVSRAELRRLSSRLDEWQRSVTALARNAGLDVVTIGMDQAAIDDAVARLFAERRWKRRQAKR